MLRYQRLDNDTQLAGKFPFAPNAAKIKEGIELQQILRICLRDPIPEIMLPILEGRFHLGLRAMTSPLQNA